MKSLLLAFGLRGRGKVKLKRPKEIKGIVKKKGFNLHILKLCNEKKNAISCEVRSLCPISSFQVLERSHHFDTLPFHKRQVVYWARRVVHDVSFKL